MKLFDFSFLFFLYDNFTKEMIINHFARKILGIKKKIKKINKKFVFDQVRIKWICTVV